MAINFNGNIDVEKIIDRIINLVSGTTASELIVLGTGLLAFDKLDVFVYVFQTIFKGDSVSPPGDEFNWQAGIGILFIIIGLLIRFYSWNAKTKIDLHKEKINFKETFNQLSGVKIQDEFERLYGVKNAEVAAIKAILNHSNVNRVLGLFQLCHINVLYSYPWFRLSGRFFKLKSRVGFLFSAFMFIYGVMCFLIGVAGFWSLFIVNNWQLYFVMACLVIIGAYLIFIDVRRIGTAITLVEKCNPCTIQPESQQTEE